MNKHSQLIVEASIAAGPRKGSTAELELGEDVACLAQTRTHMAFCLCDGTSNEKSFLGLSTRRLAQDFAGYYVHAALASPQGEDPARLATETLNTKWNNLLQEKWQQLDERTQQKIRETLPPAPDGGQAIQLSLVFIAGLFEHTSHTLQLVGVGDCSGWVFSSDQAPFYVEPFPNRFAIWLQLPPQSLPVVQVPRNLFNLRRHCVPQVEGWIFLTDGVANSETLTPVVYRMHHQLPELIQRFKRLRTDSGDDRGLITAYHIPEHRCPNALHNTES